MNTFHDLFRQPTRRVGGAFPLDRRRELFPGFVERSPKLHLWLPEQPGSEQGARLLLGVATWSGYDMNLLDLIEEAPHANGIDIEVVDVDTLPSAEDVTRVFPGLEFAQSPLVGYWVGGKLIEVAQGFAARQLVARLLGLNAAEVEERLNSVLSRT